MKTEALRRLTSGRKLSLALIIFGAGLLLYVGSQYGQMYLAQRRLAREWEFQQLEGNRVQPGIPADGLTRLSVPRINLSAVVVEGSSRRALLLGPGHVEGTAEPGGNGNSVITGHRDTFFRHLYELNKGDIVTVQRKGRTYTYKVTAKKIVGPDEVAVMQPSSESRLTLITCYPTYYVGPAPERLVVISQRLDDGQEETRQPAVVQSKSTIQ
jgi:LPXTG-site transpeptidase (sortase) family protein